MKWLYSWMVGWLMVAVPAVNAERERGATLLMEWPARESPGPVTRGPLHLELGPMVGHVSSTNALVWAQASGPARLGLRVGQRADLGRGRVIQGPRLQATNAFMGTVAVPGLQPSQRYYYCMLLNGAPAALPPYPSFTTAPPEGSKGRMRFAFTSCVGNHGYDAAPGYADMAARTNLDLVLMLGDNHYANTTDPDKQRACYADQRRQSGWRDLSARTPVYAIWDDHDYGPNNSDGRLKGKAQSLQTFKEQWANPAYGEPDNPGIYFNFCRGDVEFFMLDDRYHRDPNNARNLTHKTMLGAKQLAWLKRELGASRAAVKVLVSGGEWQSHGTDDSWTSFPQERDEIFKFIEDQGIQGVLLISGDRHYTGAYQVRGRWIEVTSGPIGSSNASTKDLPEMFLNFSRTKGLYYCVYDVDTRSAQPVVTLEVYRVSEGLVTRRTFTWDEVLGVTRIPTLSAASAKPGTK